MYLMNVVVETVMHVANNGGGGILRRFAISTTLLLRTKFVMSHHEFSSELSSSDVN